MLNIFRGIVFLLLTCMGIAHAADTGWLTSPQNDHARIRFQAEEGKERLYGLLSVELDSGWKTYWRSPGESGVAPQIVWNNGVQAQWFWPVPSRFNISGLTAQGYHNPVVIPMIITGAPDDVLEGTLMLSTCSNVCLLTDYKLRLYFNQPVDGDFQDAFEQAMRTIPADKGVANDLSAHLVGSNLLITATTFSEWKKTGSILTRWMAGSLPAIHIFAPRAKTSGSRARLPMNGEKSLRPKVLSLYDDFIFHDPNSPRSGAQKPKLTLVVFTDHNCPYCKKFAPYLEKIVGKYPDVAVIFKFLPWRSESSVISARDVLTGDEMLSGWILYEQFDAMVSDALKKQ